MGCWEAWGALPSGINQKSLVPDCILRHSLELELLWHQRRRPAKQWRGEEAETERSLLFLKDWQVLERIPILSSPGAPHTPTFLSGRQ